jgi:hypothetical protein
MNRRSFMAAILAAGVAPAYVRYGSLMVPRTLGKPWWIGANWRQLPTLDLSDPLGEFETFEDKSILRQHLKDVDKALEEFWEMNKVEPTSISFRLLGNLTPVLTPLTNKVTRPIK